MENTSKALLIAGAILVSVLIISIGLFIVSSINTELVESEMSQVEINIFNQGYLLYEGVQQGKKVKQVLIKAAMYNEELTQKEGYGNFSVLSEHGFGIRGSAKDIIDQASKKSSDWIQQLTFKGNYKVGVAQPANIRLIASWINPDKKYDVSFSYANTGKIREIIINDVQY